MTLKQKIEKTKKLIKEANEIKKLSYQNFFHFLSFDNNKKKHKKLDKAIEDLENSQFDY